MTSVATPASAEAVTKAGLCGKVAVVGLATPNAMKPYVNADCVKSVVLWNPVDLGYAATYVMRAVVDGKLKPGSTSVDAGKLGKLRSSTAARSCSARPSSTPRRTSASSTSDQVRLSDDILGLPSPGGRGVRGEGAMERRAFKMFLNPGKADEYRRRHDAIWPELKALLGEKGVRNYSIYLDPETQCCSPISSGPTIICMDELPSHPVMRRWWDFMKDIMRANPDGSPVAAPLEEMFHRD